MMHEHWLDRLARTMATGQPRRRVLKFLGIGIAGAIVGVQRPESAEAAPTCANAGQSCAVQRCCSGLTCLVSPGSSEKVCCPKARACGDTCCAAGSSCVKKGGRPTCSLTCPQDITTSLDGQCKGSVNYPTPAGATCNPPAGSDFPIGTTTVTCTGSRGDSCSFDVTVADDTLPVLDCPGDLTPIQATSPTGAVVTFSITASDNCQNSVPVECDPPSGSLFPIGTTVVQCTATDPFGNRSTCAFEVAVIE